MRNWILIFGLLAIAIAGPACKKMTGSDGSSYTTDGLDGKKPTAGESKCLPKGAVGVQGLLFKAGDDCKDINVAKCGDGVQSPGEACDGQPNCGKDCKIISGGGGDTGGGAGGGGGTADGDISISSQSTLENGVLGESYFAELFASGGSAGDYKWSVEGLSPDQFVWDSKLNWLKISSKNGAELSGKYTAKIKVCLISNASKCSKEMQYVFYITDQFRIAAYPISTSSSVSAICNSDTSCGAFAMKATDPWLTLYSPPSKGELAAPVYVLRLKVDPPIAGVSYTWSMTIDGKPALDTTNQGVVDHCNGDYSASQCPLKSVLDSAFMMDVEYENKIHSDMHDIFFGPSAFGKTLKNIDITVTSSKSGKQKIHFDEISVPSGPVKKPVVPGSQPVNPCKATPLKIDGIAIGKSNYTPSSVPKTGYDENFTIAPRIDLPVALAFKVSGAKGPYKMAITQQPDSATYTLNEKEMKATYVFPQSGSHNKLNHELGVSITSPECNTTKTVLVAIHGDYPKPAEVKLGDKDEMHFNVWTDWTDKGEDNGDTIQFLLLGGGGHTLATTSTIVPYNGGWYDSPVVISLSGDSPFLADVKTLRVSMHDDESVDWEYDYEKLEIWTQYYYAEWPKGTKTCDWDETVGNNCIAAGEVTDDEMLDFTITWKKRPHYGSKSEL